MKLWTWHFLWLRVSNQSCQSGFSKIFTRSLREGKMTLFWNIPRIYTNLSSVLRKNTLFTVIHQNSKTALKRCLGSIKIITLIATKFIEYMCKGIWDSVSFINCDVVSLFLLLSIHILCWNSEYLLLLYNKKNNKTLRPKYVIHVFII